MTAGELLRDARRRHGLTQRQLAARARTSQAAISRLERGLVSPTVETLRQLLWLMNEELVLDARAVGSGHDATLIRNNLGHFGRGTRQPRSRVLAPYEGVEGRTCRSLSSIRRRSSNAL